MSWFRKHRPRSLDGLNLIDVRQTLLSIFESGSVPQTILFAGPRGTGKTSSARIIAAMLNDPANQKIVEYIFFGGKKPSSLKFKSPNEKDDLVDRIQSGNSFVVHELDAASHRGIDDVRQLKERAAIPPQEGLISVFILDEVHMLTTEAFNALLKLLEEPPAHAVFVLATTELHKIPETVLSRCSLIQFRKATPDEISSAIEGVLKKEKIESKPEGVKKIIELADGSFRDALKMAEQVASTSGKLTGETVDKVFAMSGQLPQQIMIAIFDKDPSQLMENMKRARDQGVGHKVLLCGLINYLHQELLKMIDHKDSDLPSPQAAVFMLQIFNKLPANQDEALSLLSIELAGLDVIFRAKKNDPGTPKKKKIEVLETKSDPEQALEVSSCHGQELSHAWQEYLSAVEKRNSTIAALLRSSKPAQALNGTLSVEVFYPFHHEQLRKPANYLLLKECAELVIGHPVDLDLVLAKSQAKDDIEAVAEASLV